MWNWHRLRRCSKADPMKQMQLHLRRKRMWLFEEYCLWPWSQLRNCRLLTWWEKPTLMSFLRWRNRVPNLRQGWDPAAGSLICLNLFPPKDSKEPFVTVRRSGHLKLLQKILDWILNVFEWSHPIYFPFMLLYFPFPSCWLLSVFGYSVRIRCWMRFWIRSGIRLSTSLWRMGCMIC